MTLNLKPIQDIERHIRIQKKYSKENLKNLKDILQDFKEGKWDKGDKTKTQKIKTLNWLLKNIFLDLHSVLSEYEKHVVLFPKWREENKDKHPSHIYNYNKINWREKVEKNNPYVADLWRRAHEIFPGFRSLDFENHKNADLFVRLLHSLTFHFIDEIVKSSKIKKERKEKLKNYLVDELHKLQTKVEELHDELNK